MQHERKIKIIELLQEEGVVKVNELMKLFGVSIETIRRDLENLEQSGILTRVYGGAIPNQPIATEPTYATREVKNFMQKKKIGEVAIEQVKDEDVIGIDIGTTTLAFAKALVGKRKVTVITNSMKIALVLSEDPNIRVIMVGGEVRYGDTAVSGTLAINNAAQFITDKYFLGLGGLTVARGVTDYHLEESNLRKVMIKNTQKLIALADHSKMGAVAMNKVCDLNQIDVLITDFRLDELLLKELKKENINIITTEE